MKYRVQDHYYVMRRKSLSTEWECVAYCWGQAEIRQRLWQEYQKHWDAAVKRKESKDELGQAWNVIHLIMSWLGAIVILAGVFAIFAVAASRVLKG